jgi:hypothetical protein
MNKKELVEDVRGTSREREDFEAWWTTVGQTIGKVTAWAAWKHRAALSAWRAGPQGAAPIQPQKPLLAAEASAQNTDFRATDDVERGLAMRLYEALGAVKACLHHINDNESAITDTLWFSDHETLFDFIEAELLAAQPGLNSNAESPKTLPATCKESPLSSVRATVSRDELDAFSEWKAGRAVLQGQQAALLAVQERLGAEFEKVLYDHLPELYETDGLQAAPQEDKE